MSQPFFTRKEILAVVRWIRLLVLLAGSFLTQAATHKTSTGILQYQDDFIRSHLYSQSYSLDLDEIWSEETGYKTSVGVSYQHKNMFARNEGARPLMGKDDQRTIRTTQFSIGQGLGIGRDFQIFLGEQKSGFSRATWQGVGYGHWLRQETLQISATIRRNHQTQESLDYTDLNGQRVISPARVEGLNIGVATFWILTSKSTLNLDYSQTKSSNRPVAWSSSAQFRQYLESFNGAVHLGAAHYENVGRTTLETSYGSVISNSVYLEAHKKWGRQWISMLGARTHREDEKPRSATQTLTRNASDFYSSSLRYRFKKSWVQPSSEVGFMVGRYLSNYPLSGNVFGLSLDLIF